MELSNAVLGIEFGSTRIKAVLLDRSHSPVASGSYEWENQLVDGIWTYSLDEVQKGLRACYASLRRELRERYGQELTKIGAIGVSAMMHGYLPLDKNGCPLTQFRTWRNTMTGEAAEALTELFHFNIPQRWCIAHLYQAILNGEEHVKDIVCLTTLAGYVHWRLTGEKIVGMGEASGIFPLEESGLDYNSRMLALFDERIAPFGFPWKLRELLPRGIPAGQSGGALTEAGALYLDPTGTLKPGIPAAPCEGDAETGMVATNSVRVRTGNVSAGTSDFAMLVTDHPLGVHREVGIVATPSGLPVAMVHCSNCTSDLNAWTALFSEFAEMIGASRDRGVLFSRLFQKALEGEADGGGLLSYNYFSGESVTGLDKGRPVFARMPNCRFTLANFMRTHLLSALATLKIGMDILEHEERVELDRLCGHGGFFKTPGVGQRLLSAAIGVPVTVMETAGEGGPYGMALLCAYMLWKAEGESLEDYLEEKVFRHVRCSTVMAEQSEIDGFNIFLERYKRAFPVEQAATESL